MNNASAARRAFEMLLICYNPPRRLMLRQGARVLCKEVAVGGFREWVLTRSRIRHLETGEGENERR